MKLRSSQMLKSCPYSHNKQKRSARLMSFPPALLEEWIGCYYFGANIDIGSSGVEPFTFGELRAALGIEQEELDRIPFRDSEGVGGDGLRRAIANRWARGDIESVMATHGSSEA